MVTDYNVKKLGAKRCADCKEYRVNRNICLRIVSTIERHIAEDTYNTCKYYEKGVRQDD